MVTFDLREPSIAKKIIVASSPQNFDYHEEYYLIGTKKPLAITPSIQTLTIFAISAHSADLYAELFDGWHVAVQEQLAFYHSKRNIMVIFRPDWTIQVHHIPDIEKVFSVTDSDVFDQLKEYLQCILSN